jgi:hypothetical protein
VTKIVLEGLTYSLEIGTAEYDSGSQYSVRTLCGEVRLSGVRGAEYRSIRSSEQESFYFVTMTGRARLPRPRFDGARFVLEGETIRLATYEEVMADRIGRDPAHPAGDRYKEEMT